MIRAIELADCRQEAKQSENRLVRHGYVTIVYDGDGNRVGETVGGVTTSYLVDTKNPTGYAQVGEQYDPVLGLYYNRARWLNTNIGRFWTALLAASLAIALARMMGTTIRDPGTHWNDTENYSADDLVGRLRLHGRQTDLAGALVAAYRKLAVHAKHSGG